MNKYNIPVIINQQLTYNDINCITKYISYFNYHNTTFYGRWINIKLCSIRLIKYENK